MSQKKTGGKISLWKRFFLQSYSSAIVAIILLIFIFSVFTDAFLPHLIFLTYQEPLLFMHL